MSAELQTLHDKLAGAILPRRRLLTAYSGGVDSTLVAAMARRVLGKAHAPAAIGDSASLPRHELEEARQFADSLDIELLHVNPGEQQDPQYLANDPSRCFHCKTNLYHSLHELAARLDIPFIANGTNRDDLGDYRPGLAAAQQAQVVSPLLEAGLDKAQVRQLARHLGLPNADKPAAPCLASRIPYGTPVTPLRLSMVEAAEDSLRQLGFTGFRVRHHETMARLEIPLDQIMRLMSPEFLDEVVRAVRQAGYEQVTLDLQGFRSGSGNAALNILK